MSTQPEALRLADALIKYLGGNTATQAAAELRRLHAENESLRQIVQDFPPIEAELREVSDRAHRLETQRDALLGLLKEARKIIRASSSRNLVKDWDQRTTDVIKAVEGEKK
jgi:hypothetical protein